MAKSVAVVSSLEGQAWAKAADGSMRALKVGDTVAAEEVVVTATGAHIELDFGDGHPVSIAGSKEVTMDRDLWTDLAADNKDASIDDASVKEALTVLNNGGDLTQNLEETAAGLSGGGSNEGHDFVELTRLVESTDPQAFNFAFNGVNGSNTQQSLPGSLQENHAPILAQQSVSGDEDTVLSGQIQANDPENDVLTYAVSGQPANGTLVLDPATGAFTYTPNANYNGPDSFVVTVTDDHGNTSTSTVALSVNPVNDAPVTANQNLTTAEDTPVAGQVVATDVEGDTLAYSVTTAAANGTVTINAATGAFIYTPGANFNGGDSFVVTVSDGNGGTTTSTIVIGVTPVNDAPVSANQNLTTLEDTPINGAVAASDVDGDSLSYAISGAANNGSVTLNPTTGAFVYTPNANFNGSDSFVVTINDGHGGTTTSTINIGVTPVNDAPVSSNLSLTTPEDTSVAGNVVASDVEGDTLNYVITGAASNGTVTLDPATGAFVYTPNANYNGGDSFVVTVSDGNGGTTTSTITIGVTPVNDAPESSNQNLTTAEDTPVSGAVVATDLDGDTLTFAVSGNASSGSVTLDPTTGAFVYTPNANFNGGDSFVVTISDGNGGTTTSTITIGVTPVNDAPVANNQNLTTAEDTPINGAVAATDVDGDVLSYSVSGTASNGTVTLNAATGTFVYTPNSNFNGSDSFVVTINDGHGGITTSTINIGVTPANDAPVANNQNLTTPEGTPINGAVLATDADGDTLAYSVNGAASHGSVALNAATGAFVYTPTADFNGADSFTVRISDGQGGTIVRTVNINVTPVNDAPVAIDDAVSTTEDTAVTVAVRGNDTDVDGDSLTVSGVTQGANGSVVIDAVTGNPIYTPNTGFNGADSFTYTVSDGHGGTATATVAVNVGAANEAPVSSDKILVTNEDTSIGGAVVATDPDGDTLTYSVSSNPVNGSVVLDVATGAFVYTPNANFNGPDFFFVSVADGNGHTTMSQVTVIVTPANDAPESANQSLTTAEDTPISGGVVASDVDSGTLTYTLSGNASNGSVTLDSATGAFVYTPNASYNGSDSFVVTISDGFGGTTTSTISIGVTPVNDAPTAFDDTATTDESTAVTVAVRSNDLDPDGDALTVTGVTQGANGSVVIDAVTGNPIYTPNSGFTGSDSFTYTVDDGNGGTSSATVTVTVSGEPTIVTPDTKTIAEDTSTTGNVLSNDSDADNTLEIVSFNVNGNTYSANDTAMIPSVGSLTMLFNGHYLFQPEANYNGSVPTVTYTTNTGASSTLDITVNPVNDAPVANDDNFSVGQNTDLTIPETLLTGNDTDADGDALTVTSVSAAVNGTVSLVGGVVTFTPTPGFSGSTSFTYTVEDPSGAPTTAVAHITVLNQPSVLVADTDTTLEDNMVSGNVLSNDSDSDDSLSVVSFTIDGNTYAEGVTALIPGVGTLYLQDDGFYLFVPAADFNGSVPPVTYTTNTGATSTLNITVTPDNDTPTANDDNFSVNSNTDLTITAAQLTGNDTDADGDLLTVMSAFGAVNGTVSLVGGVVTFTPTPGFSGTASFSYTVEDPTGAASTAVAHITVLSQPSVLVADAVTINEESTVVGGVLTNDSDPDDTLSVVSFTIDGNTYAAGDTASIPSVGTLYLQADGGYLFTPVADYNGSVPTVTYTTNTGFSSTLDITVNPENDAPTTFDENLLTLEDTPVNGLVVANDPDFDALTYTLSDNASNGTVSLDPVTGDFVYTPNANYNGGDSFKVTISDGHGGTTTSTINIGVIAVNYAPESSDQNLTTPEDTPLVGAVAATDADGDALNYTVTTNVTHGVVSLNAATGDFTYTPGANYHGSDSFVVTISDGNGGTTTSTINIGVTPVNDAPVSSNQSLTTPEDTPLVGAVVASDVDGDALSYTVTTNVTHGAVSLNASTGDFTYTPGANYNGSDSFVVTISDGNGGTTTSTINIGVTPVNDAPVSVADSISVLEGGTATVLVSGATSVLANDSDTENDALAAVLVSGPAHGTLTLNANGTFSYTHDGGETTTDSFTYRANDGTANGNIVTVNIGVTPVNDAPVTVADSISVLEGGTATVLVSGASSVLTNDTDAENNTLSAVLVTGPTHGTLTLNANGTFSYVHDGSETTTDSFTYRANDGSANGNIVTVNIGVTPVNDAPVAVADSISVLEGGTATVLVSGATSVLTNDTDAENNSLNAVLVTGPAHGTLTLNANGTFSYVHDGSETTTDSFTYRANDGSANGNVVTVNIGVTPVNDVPVAVADSISVLEGGTATVLVSGATSVLTNDTDAENNSLSAVLVAGPAHGTLTLNANGTFSYTHDGGETTSDSFTYRANDGTANGNVVTVNIGVTPVNDAPVAVNDPASAAYSVQLGDAASSDLWTNADSKGQSITINAYKTNGTTTSLYSGTVDSNANVLGVGIGNSGNANNTPRTNNGGNPQSDVPNQIEYDVKTGKSEALELNLNGNINSATFAVSRLYPGESGGEVGMWQAFYKGTLVTSGTFRLGGSSNAGSFTITTGALVFDSVKFLALGTNDGTGDGADYFLTSFSGSGPASSNTNYTVAEGGTLSIGSSSSFKLLSNDTDADGDTLSVAQINGSAVTDGQTVTLASGALLLIHSNGSFDYSTGSAFNSLSAGQVTTDSFSYTTSDGHGGTSTATATMTVIGKNLTGTLGGDTLVGGSYSETIMGLAGSDNLTGGAGADTFKWSLNDQGTAGSPATDTITDFNTAQGDVLNLKDLLQGEGASNITNYLHFSSDGTNTTVSVSSIGAFNGSNYGTAADQAIVLNNVNLTGTDTDIINQLKNNGNLITD